MQWVNFPESFLVNQMTPNDSFISPNARFLLFYAVDVALCISWEGKVLDMESEDKLQPVSK